MDDYSTLKGNKNIFLLFYYLKGYYNRGMKRRDLNQLTQETGELANFVRSKRKSLGYTQAIFSKRVGIGLRFLKELELGKKSLQMDKVEQVLNYFGYQLTPVRIEYKDEVQ